MNKIILLGAPGSGKGTISNYLINNYHYGHLSTGDMFRAAINNPNDPLGVQIKNIIAAGELVPDDLTNSLVAANIKTMLDQDMSGFILDGYPRTIPQANFLSSIINVDSVIYLHVDEKILINRLTGRRLCSNCNAIYNVNTEMKPQQDGVCDKCHSVLIQRKDDNLESVKLRIDEYNQKTKPLIDYYQAKGILKIIEADAPLNTIYSEIDKLL